MGIDFFRNHKIATEKWCMLKKLHLVNLEIYRVFS